MTATPPAFRPYQRRAYQRAALKLMRQIRLLILLWRRQAGKSTTLAEAALYEMMSTPGRLVTYASASLLLGREIILKEASILQKTFRQMAAAAEQSKLQLQTANRETHKVVDNINVDDFAELFESQKLELRLYHSPSVFSRTQVIAPNPATARGWSGTVMLDEFGFIRDFQDLWEAVEPIVSTDPDFRFILATTPPKDDAHYSYELTAPLLGTKFDTNPEGNFYQSQAKKTVHRVDIHDGYAAGVKLYDLDSGKELTPEEHFRQADDKDAWRRNYKVEHVLGGTSACGLIQLDTAQKRGEGKCAFFLVDSDDDFERALAFLESHLSDHKVGIGIDVATTEQETSNPTAVAVCESVGVEKIIRLIVAWKTTDPKIARYRIRRIVEVCASRPRGGKPRKVCIDATNERYFATDVADMLRLLVPVELVVGSETIQRLGEKPITMKQFLGGKLVAELEDNHLTLPTERYVRDDFRLVKKDRGNFVCTPTPDGKHGDTFDATKLSIHAVDSSHEPAVSVPQSAPGTRLYAERNTGLM